MSDCTTAPGRSRFGVPRAPDAGQMRPEPARDRTRCGLRVPARARIERATN